MQDKIYVVSFQFSESTYCSNVVFAKSKEEVEKEYSRYSWYDVREGDEHDVREAQKKGKPIIRL